MKPERNKNQKKPAGLSCDCSVSEKNMKPNSVGTQLPLAGIMKRSSKHDGGVRRTRDDTRYMGGGLEIREREVSGKMHQNKAQQQTKTGRMRKEHENM